MSMDTWPTDFSPEALANWLNQYTEGTLIGHLHIWLVEVSARRVVAELPIHPGVCMRSGLVHTGAMLSLADTAATFAAMAAKGSGFAPERFPVAIGLSSQMVGNVQEGVLRAESVVMHPGRTPFFPHLPSRYA